MTDEAHPDESSSEALDRNMRRIRTEGLSAIMGDGEPDGYTADGAPFWRNPDGSIRWENFGGAP